MKEIEDANRSTIKTPDWVKDAIFYQIFPDRFAKSNHVPKPGNLQAWGDRPTQNRYQGGDLLGIVEHLDYLEDLGINAIYLNPIFQSASNHRYHTHDYWQVDPLLGGNNAMRALVDAAHKRDIRIILDGVFNHASRGFFQFNDILENGSDSPWIDWFVIEEWPLAPYDGSKPANYSSWWGNRALPKLNTDNPQVREYIMSIAEYWVREFDIDGWRLDVPEEIQTEGFWEEFRRRVKAVKPDAYIVGEIWQEARAWLQGDRFDATMNYLLGAAVIAFTFGGRVSSTLVEGRAYEPYPAIDAQTFGMRVKNNLDLYDWGINQVQFNLLASHDTARLVSLSRGDMGSIRLATLLLMTFPGAPSIYYGDEIGLRGAEDYEGSYQDSDARWAFPWHDEDSWDRELLAYFKEIIALRKANEAFRHGLFEQLFSEAHCYAFVRHTPSQTLVVLLNAGEEAERVTLPVGGYFENGKELQTLFGQGSGGLISDGRLVVSIPARAGLVLAAQ